MSLRDQVAPTGCICSPDPQESGKGTGEGLRKWLEQKEGKNIPEAPKEMGSGSKSACAVGTGISEDVAGIAGQVEKWPPGDMPRVKVQQAPQQSPVPAQKGGTGKSVGPDGQHPVRGPDLRCHSPGFKQGSG